MFSYDFVIYIDYKENLSITHNKQFIVFYMFAIPKNAIQLIQMMKTFGYLIYQFLFYVIIVLIETENQRLLL